MRSKAGPNSTTKVSRPPEERNISLNVAQSSSEAKKIGCFFSPLSFPGKRADCGNCASVTLENGEGGNRSWEETGEREKEREALPPPPLCFFFGGGRGRRRREQKCIDSSSSSSEISALNLDEEEEEEEGASSPRF